MKLFVTYLVLDARHDILVDPVELLWGSSSVLGAMRANCGSLALGHGAQHLVLVLAAVEVGQAVDREVKRLLAVEISSVVGVDFGNVGLPVYHVMSAAFCSRVGLAVRQSPRLK